MNDELKDLVILCLSIINVIMMFALWDEGKARRRKP